MRVCVILLFFSFSVWADILDEKLSGQWILDISETKINHRKTVKQTLALFKNITLTFQKGKKVKIVGVGIVPYKVNGKKIIFNLDPSSPITFEFKGDTLFGVFKWSDTTTLYPVFMNRSAGIDAQTLFPYRYGHNYRTIGEYVHKKYRYIIFMKDGRFLYSKNKIPRPHLATFKNSYSYYTVNNKIIINNGKILLKPISKDKFWLIDGKDKYLYRKYIRE